MTSTHVRLACSNVFATLGYISVIIQWLWSGIILAYPLLSSDLSRFFPHSTQPQAPAAPVDPPSLVSVVIVIALTIFIFALTLYALWKLPSAVGRGGARVTRQTADALLPVITHHRKKSAKERRRLSYKLVVYIKWSLVIAPLAALIWASSVDALEPQIIWTVAGFCALCSAAYFGIQQLLVGLWKVPSDKTW